MSLASGGVSLLAAVYHFAVRNASFDLLARIA